MSCCCADWVSVLARDHAGRLAAIARREGVSATDALDVVQDAFHTLISRPDSDSLRDKPDDAARVLSTIVRNAARNLRRRHHRARPHDGEVDALAAPDDTLAAIARAEDRLAMSACVAELGDGAQRVVMMRLLDELSGDEVAAQLGTTPGNVAVMLHRARERLRACLASADVTP